MSSRSQKLLGLALVFTISTASAVDLKVALEYPPDSVTAESATNKFRYSITNNENHSVFIWRWCINPL